MTATGAEDKKDSKGSVLLVDDDKFLLDMYAMKFSQAGYVTHASLSANAWWPNA